MGATRAGRSAEGGLAPAMAARAYDRIGRLQDTQAPIERAAVERMVVAGRLRDARAIFELGCGTGALARRLLSDVLADTATYVGADVSPRMVALACRRLAPWPQRSRVVQLDGTLPLPVPDGCADRFVAAYALDLLEPAVLALHVVKKPGGTGASGGRRGDRGPQVGVLDAVVDEELGLEDVPAPPQTGGVAGRGGLGEQSEVSAEGVVGDEHHGEVDRGPEWRGASEQVLVGPGRERGFMRRSRRRARWSRSGPGRRS